MDGAVKGESTGMKSKQLAKEEAARQAYHAMGWAPRTLGLPDRIGLADSLCRCLKVSPRQRSCFLEMYLYQYSLAWWSQHHHAVRGEAGLAPGIFMGVCLHPYSVEMLVCDGLQS